MAAASRPFQSLFGPAARLARIGAVAPASGIVSYVPSHAGPLLPAGCTISVHHSLSRAEAPAPEPLPYELKPALWRTLRHPSLHPGLPAGSLETPGRNSWQPQGHHPIASHGLASVHLRCISGPGSNPMAPAPEPAATATAAAAAPEAPGSSINRERSAAQALGDFLRNAADPGGEALKGPGEGPAAHRGAAPGVRMLGGLPPTRPGEKPRVVVLGSGWAACRFLKELDTKAFDVVSISPRNHMVFTPLLASTCVGTLEFRSVAEPVEVIQPAVSREPNSHFYLANCVAVDPARREIECEAVSSEDGVPRREGEGEERWRFSVAYDKLVIAVGAEAATFGIQGVHQNALFLREVQHAQHIRRRLLLNLMKCETPGLSDAEKRQILSCVVVGGGPTGVEFSGELGDFIRKDVSEKYAHVKDYISVTLIEASEILSSFDVRLREYAVTQLTKAGVSLVKGQVREVRGKSIVLTDGTQVPYGLLVWSTGVGPTPFIQGLLLPKAPGGRVAVDERLGVVGHPDIFALGDCAGYDVSTGKSVLPALAQVAERQGRYLAHRFNALHKKSHWGKPGASGPSSAWAHKERTAAEQLGAAAAEAGGGGGGGGAQAPSNEEPNMGALDLGDKPFVYRHLGSMATIGRYSALVDLRENKSAPGISLKGFFSFLVWRSAYLTRLISWRNRLYVMVNWATTMVFGRDVSKI